MSPENAKICVVDDTQTMIEALQDLFETSDHKVLLTARTKEAALKAIGLFKQYEINVVLLDTRLVHGDFEGREAREVLKKIRSVAPNVKVITMSGEEPLEGGDVKMYKTLIGEHLLDVVNNL